QMRGETLASRDGLDGRGTEDQRRNAERQGEQGEQSAAAAGPQRQRRGETADQRQRRRADQQGGAQRGEALGLEPEGHAQKRRQDGKRQAGHNPVSGALGQRRELERPGRQQQQIERAVLMVGREQAIERQQRGEQRRAPQHARRDACKY